MGKKIRDKLTEQVTNIIKDVLNKNKKVIEVYDTPTMIDGKKNKRQVNGASY